MSLKNLIELSKVELTPEQIAENNRKAIDRLKQYEKEIIERRRCSYCGTDTLNDSHAFSCPLRGLQ